MNLVIDDTKHGDIRGPALESYLRCANAQETRDGLIAFLDKRLDISRVYRYAIIAYDEEQDDTEKRKAIVATVFAALMKEEDKKIFARADEDLAARSNPNDPPLLLPGQSVTNNLPSSGFVWIHAPATNSGTATLMLSFKGTGIASNYTASASVKATAFEIERPSGDTIGWKNGIIWYGEDMGLTFNCKITPDLPDTEIYWFLDANDFPAGSETKITWEPWDVKNNRPHIGVGASPKLKVTYENPQSKYTDFMPPDNRWFGKKKITIQVGNQIVTRPVWFFFNSRSKLTLRQGGKKEVAWFHYFKENDAVPSLSYFEYDDSVSGGLQTWDPFFGDRYYVGYAADYTKKSVFNVNVPNSYTEENYPKEEGSGAHGVAKTCVHELWHSLLNREVRWVLLGGLGHPDSDGDYLSGTREAELGTNPNVKDTCGISLYTDGPISYSIYTSYADQELFCRWREYNVQGNDSKDWSNWRFERERLKGY